MELLASSNLLDVFNGLRRKKLFPIVKLGALSQFRYTSLNASHRSSASSKTAWVASSSAVSMANRW